MKKVVVLGANGFLGSAMTDYLARAGHEVIAYSRQPSRRASMHPNVRIILADIRDTWTLADAMEGADVVYHFASATHPSLFFSNPSAEYWEAVQPLLTVMEIAGRVNVKKIVFPSSGGTVYAESDEPRSEDSLTDPRSPYAILKLTAEQLLHHAARLGQFSVDIFRIGNPYGPRQLAKPGQGVIPHWIKAILNNQTLMVFGDGSAERDYIYVDDVVRLMAVSLERSNESGTFNLGTGIATSLSQLLGYVRTHSIRPFAVENVPGRPSDIGSIALSPNKILRIVPNFQFTPVYDGLHQVMREHNIAN